MVSKHLALDSRAIFLVTYDMQIRRANMKNKTEVGCLFRIQQAAYSIEAEILGLKPNAFFPLRETVEELQHSSDEVWVYLLDDVVTGAIFLEKSGDCLAISKLVVDPSFFRRGIAKSLVRHCLNLHLNTEFHVGTGALNRPAILLYESFDFKIFHEEIVESNLKIVKLKRPANN
jgi:ribosomal protein S18 acetylase RimI-like enzyme